MYHVEVLLDDGLDPTIPTDLLGAAARAALAHQNAPPGELTVLITGDERMIALSRTHRGVPASTDVLSFPAGAPIPIPGSPRYFGDIAINLPRAREQAAAGGHAPEEELQLLVVHGTLHLLGHQHGGQGGQRRMWAAQEEILGSLGVSVALEGSQ